MLHALSLAFGQLSDPRILRLIGFSLAITLGLFVGLYFLADYLISTYLSLDGWWGNLLSGVGTFLIAWFTFPMFAVALAALFSDQVIDAVMARHYPGRQMPHSVSIPEMIIDGLKMALIALVGNVLALVFLLVPFAYPFVAYGLNGYLLGREYYEMPAFRRLPRPEAKALFERHRGRFVLSGVVIAFLSTIPFVNLIAPIIGIAFMVHMFESVVNLGSRRG